MQRLEVSGVVRLMYRSLGVKALNWLVGLRCSADLVVLSVVERSSEGEGGV